MGPSRFERLAGATRWGALPLSLAITLIAPTSQTAAAASGNSGAQPGPPSGWIYYPAPPAAHSTVTIVQGQTDGHGGCNFALSGSSRLRGGVNAETEIAVNVTTCQAKYQSQALGSGAFSPTSGSYASTTTAGSGGVDPSLPIQTPIQPLAAGDESAYSRNNYLDPFGIQTTSQEQWLNWNTNGTCVQSYNWTNKYSDLNDGWEMYQKTDNSYFNGCSLVLTDPDSSHENSAFCATATTYNWYGWQSGTEYGDYLIGYAQLGSQSYGWNIHDSVGGSCWWLLHHGHVDS